MIYFFSGLLACVQESSTPSNRNSRQPAQQNTDSGDGRSQTDSGNGFSDGTTDGFLDDDDSGSGTDDPGLDPTTGTSGERKSEPGPPNPDGDPSEVIYLTGGLGSYLSPLQNEPKEDVEYSCPGDSFLIGEKSEWDRGEDSGDRTYQFRCQFLTDGQGLPIRKTKCSLSDPISDGVIDFSCPVGKYLAGQVSSYNEETKNRTYQYECCEARSEQNGEKLSPNIGTSQITGETLEMCTTDKDRVPAQLQSHPIFTSQVNVDVNNRMGSLDYDCSAAAILPQGGMRINLETEDIPYAILNRVKSTFYPDAQDRRHSFYCCQLQVGGSEDN